MSLPVNKAKSDAARAEGNTSFKKGRWTDSIGHYTTAVIHNPEDPLAYGNRAQAYLKLDKYTDAERDCTTALEKVPGNVKALYRRALARKGLEHYDDAISDLNQLLLVEVGNAAAMEELAEVQVLKDRLMAAKEAKPKRPRAGSSLPKVDAGTTPNVQVPISPSTPSMTPVNPKVASKSEATFSSLKSSRAGKKAAFVPPMATSTGTAKPLQADSCSPEYTKVDMTPSEQPSSRPSRAPMGSPPLPNSTSITPSPLPKPPTDPLSTATGSGILLLRTLNSLSPVSGWALLKQYPPSNIPLILGPILEPDSLGSVLLALVVGAQGSTAQQGAGEMGDREKVKIILEGLKTTPRFGINTMMLDPAAAEAGRSAWREAGGDGSWP